MNLTKQQLEEELAYINRLIKDDLINDACAKYVALAKYDNERK